MRRLQRSVSTGKVTAVDEGETWITVTTKDEAIPPTAK
jgi:uncharacterized protein YjdB